MANVTETDSFDANVYQIDVGDAVIGGPGGISNIQPQQLANRTRWLYNRIGRILNSILSAVGIGNGASIGTTIISTLSLAANYLNNNGDELEFDVVGKYTNNDSLNLIIKVNTVAVFTKNIGNSVDTIIRMSGKISRIASSSQVLTVQYNEDSLAGSTANGLASQHIVPLTIDLTAVNSITFEVQNLASGANQFKVFKFTNYVNRIQP